MNKVRILFALTPVLFLAAACGEIPSSSSVSSIEPTSSISSEESSLSSSESSEVSSSISESSSEVSSSEETLRIITTPTQLAAIGDDLDFVYELGSDITLTEPWTPIGTQLNPFTGSLNGNGYSINGLSMTAESLVYEPVEETELEVTTLKGVAYMGLFGVNAGTIQNIHMNQVSLTGTATFGAGFLPDETRIHAGALAGINAGTVMNVSSSGEFSILATDARLRIGGLVGYNYNGTIQSCESSVNVSATTNLDKVGVGGLVGESFGPNGVIARVKATGNVSATMNSSDPLVEAQAYAGGIVAVLEGGNVINAYATGNVASIINGAKPSYAGGVVGMFDATDYDMGISNAYASGNVDATSITAPKAYSGGILGRYEDKGFGHQVAVTNVLANCVVTGTTVSATKAYVGTIVGDNSGATGLGWTLTNGYYAGTASFVGKSNGTTPVGTQTTLETMTAATMGWDTNIWSIESGVVSFQVI